MTFQLIKKDYYSTKTSFCWPTLRTTKNNKSPQHLLNQTDIYNMMKLKNILQVIQSDQTLSPIVGGHDSPFQKVTFSPSQKVTKELPGSCYSYTSPTCQLHKLLPIFFFPQLSFALWRRFGEVVHTWPRVFVWKAEVSQGKGTQWSWANKKSGKVVSLATGFFCSTNLMASQPTPT